MNEPIVNRVAISKLITFDLQEFYPKGERVFFDISEWLEQGLVLKEKKFRDKAKDYAWKEFVGNQSIFQKALKCGWYAMYRNIENGSLIVYWAYSIGWKIYGYFLRRSSNKSILEAMFPRGLFQFMIGQIRTMALLYGFGFIFWI